MSTDGSSELVRSLNTQLAETGRKLSSRIEQAKRLVAENTALKTRVGELETTNAAVTTERDTFKARAEAAPSEKDAEISRLTGEIKTRDLRDHFTAIAAKELAIETVKDGKTTTAKLTVRPDAMAPLLRELALKPDDKGELPTEAQITEALKGAATAHPWAFQAGETPNPAADAANRQIRTQAATAGPGAARSVTDNAQRMTAADSINAGWAQSGTRSDGRI